MTNLKQSLTQKTSLILLALLLVGGLSFAGLGLNLLPSAKAQDNGALPNYESDYRQRVSLRSLKGRYTDSATATVLPGGFAPAACVGIVTFDGRGNLTATETHSFNGFIIPEAHYTGTYTMNEDGTGIMTITSLEQGFEFKQKFVLNETTQEITYIVIEDGEVSTGTMKKM